MISLSSLHTFGFDAHCTSLLQINHSDELCRVGMSLNSDEPWMLLGEGSNTVFVEDYQGTILRVAIPGIDVSEQHSHTRVKVGAGENWHRLVQWCLVNGIYGLENLALIPGSVGAAPIQNIGAYGQEVATFIDEVHFWNVETGALEALSRKECEFGYRDSVFKHALCGKAVITSVSFLFPKYWQAVTDYAELKALCSPSPQDIFNTVVSVRKQKLPDPAEVGNAGSFFKNPTIAKAQYQDLLTEWPDMPHYPVSSNQVKVPAAWLIDRLGFKGKTLGGISCHITQPLVLTNNGSGNGEQLLQLAREIRDSVRTEFAISLENEVRLIGQQGLIAL